MKRPSLRRASPRVRRVRLTKYKQLATKKLRVLIAMLKTAQTKLNQKAEQASVYLVKADSSAEDGSVRPVHIDLSHLIENMQITLEELKLLK